MNLDAFNSRGRFGCAVPVIAGAALALAGCADSVPPYTPIYTATARAALGVGPDGWAYRNGGTYAPPIGYSRPAPVVPPVSTPPPSYSVIPRAQAPVPVSDPPPLRAVAPDPPSGLRFLPSVTFLTPPTDATDCTGWWRICHLY